ncbi:invasion regulator SirB1 [Klebsiella variicola]|uniref:invasion regulator SirB1 n=1 Tax=Klebsiella variicola TaxID=244366 RepID=UPI001BAB9095|nr:invasion regulator SirB1 [Klebsiella variicola]MBS3652838.1 invasion regulator SirB1 [Klebsiella variicola]
MGSLADFEFNKAPLCDGMVLISEQVRDDFPSRFVEEELQRLLRLAQEEIAPSWDQERQIERLLALFYDEWGFGASQGIYRLSDALWLDKVLVNRQGSAVSLGAILLWIAQRLALPVVPVIFPTQMLLRADPETSEEMWLINPFNGETLDEHTLEVWLKGNTGPVAELFNEDLDEADNAEVIRKLLDTLKSALMEERQMELALRASEALLQFNPEDPYEIRDRGLIYAQLDCDHVALLDLSYFVEQCPEDPISEMIRAQINTISHKQITLH